MILFNSLKKLTLNGRKIPRTLNILIIDNLIIMCTKILILLIPICYI